MNRPIIALSMGDAAGIGPELVAKILAEEVTYERCRPFVLGDVAVMQKIAQAIDSDQRFRAIADLDEAEYRRGDVEVLCPDGVNISGSKSSADKVAGEMLTDFEWGKLDAKLGDAAAHFMKKGLELGQADQLQGMVLAPMNKEAFHDAGYDYMDELAYMAEITDSEDTYITGLVGTMWTATISEHVPFSDVVGYVKRDRILTFIKRVNQLLESVGRPEGTIGVAALNPHGGEGGLFGREEIDEIEPAIRMAQQDDIDARGPFPADTIFLTGQTQEYDALLCMYHDQANIARKLLGTWDGATVYMGLPIPCATTAHGTAFDIAGQGISDPSSLRTALYTVASLTATA